MTKTKTKNACAACGDPLDGKLYCDADCEACGSSEIPAVFTATGGTLIAFTRRIVTRAIESVREDWGPTLDADKLIRETLADLFADHADGWIEEPKASLVPPGAALQCRAVRPVTTVAGVFERCKQTRNHEGRHKPGALTDAGR